MQFIDEKCFVLKVHVTNYLYLKQPDTHQSFWAIPCFD